jgi:hypothetical protein
MIDLIDIVYRQHVSLLLRPVCILTECAARVVIAIWQAKGGASTATARMLMVTIRRRLRRYA